MPSPPLPFTHGERPPPGARLRRSLWQLAVAAVVLGLLGLGAGWLFGRADEPRAARLMLSDEVVQQEPADDGPGPDPALPTSGPPRGEPSCGVRDQPLEPQEQVDALAAGVVVIQHGPTLAETDLRQVLALAEQHERVLIAPNPDLDADAVATAWRHRLEQPQLNTGRLDSFVTGHRDRGPEPAACP